MRHLDQKDLVEGLGFIDHSDGEHRARLDRLADEQADSVGRNVLDTRRAEVFTDGGRELAARARRYGKAFRLAAIGFWHATPINSPRALGARLIRYSVRVGLARAGPFTLMSRPFRFKSGHVAEFLPFRDNLRKLCPPGRYSIELAVQLQYLA